MERLQMVLLLGLFAGAACSTCFVNMTHCQCSGSTKTRCTTTTDQNGMCLMSECPLSPISEMSYRCDCQGRDLCSMTVSEGLMSNSSDPPELYVPFACSRRPMMKAFLTGPISVYSGDTALSSSLPSSQCILNATHCQCRERQPNPATQSTSCILPYSTRNTCIKGPCQSGNDPGTRYYCDCTGNSVCSMELGKFFVGKEDPSNPDAPFPCRKEDGMKAVFVTSL
uniref:Uncharacterized protein n=1 Tax=Compsopogon caeruleus TaxID=31354 RepID=A0A7S1TD73_9RHOD|mmetsp:Transcript_1848/g.3359  ORF Transcript_1848/g.3359 Transcript_1848/m.3359 type:complete len:225 (+) Transcript_1848:36-710(+)